MPYAKTYYKILNQMWNEGLLDKEMFSQNYDQYLAKISSGRVVGFTMKDGRFNQLLILLRNKNSMTEFQSQCQF